MNPAVPSPSTSGDRAHDVGWGEGVARSGLGQTDDPKALIPGDPRRLLDAVKALRERDEVAFEDARKTLKNLLPEGVWSGEAANGYRRVSDVITKCWSRYAGLVPRAADAIDIYAHHLAWAQRQADVAVQRWAEAEQLEAGAEQGGEEDQTAVDVADAERQAAREILDDARGSLAEAEDRLAAQLDALAAQLSVPRAFTSGTPAPGAAGRRVAVSLQAGAPRAAVPTIGDAASQPTAPSSSGSRNGGDTPLTAPVPPSTPPEPTRLSPPIIITVSEPPTVRAGRRPYEPPPVPSTGEPPVRRTRRDPKPSKHGRHHPPDPCSPTDHPTDGQPPAPRHHHPPPGGQPLSPGDPGLAQPPGGGPSATSPTPGNTPGLSPSVPGGHPPPAVLPDAPSTGVAHGSGGPATSASPQPPLDHHGGITGLEEVIAGGTAVAVAGGAGALWMKSRRTYPIGSGTRNDYPPVEPVVHELRHLHPEPPAAYVEPDMWTAPGETEQAPLARPAARPRTPTTTTPHQPGPQPWPPPTTEPSPPSPPPAPADAAPVGDELPVSPATLDLTAAAGIGIGGNGATEVIRALLIPLLAGDTDRPRARVLLPARDCDWILGTSQLSIPGLQVVPELRQALDILDTQVRHRAAHTEPDSSPVVLVLAHPPTEPAASDALAGLLGAGHRLGVTALILGDWPTGNTLRVAHDGTVIAAEGPATEHLLHTSLAGLSTEHTLALLTQLADTEPTPDPATHHDNTHPDPDPSVGGHDIQPAPETAAAQHPTPNDTTNGGGNGGGEPDSAPALATAHDTDTDTAPREAPDTTDIPEMSNNPADPANSTEVAGTSDGTADAEGAGTGSATPAASVAPSPTLRLVVLGRVTLTWTPTSTAGGLPDSVGVDLTRKHTELFAFLAVHPDGVSRDTLAETLWPDARPNRLTNGLHSALTRLRRVVEGATGGAVTAPIITATLDGTYKINPDFVRIDLGEFREALSLQSDIDTSQRVHAYQRALALYRGHLAEGVTSGWIMVYRENVRRDALDAAANLADILVEQGKLEQAIAVYDKARDIDPFNESVCQRIMRLQLEIGHPDAAKRTLKLLTIKLRDIDAAPTAETRRIIEPRTSPENQHRAQPPAGGQRKR